MSTSKKEIKCNFKTIDILERKDLIKIAKKLNIEGSDTSFTKPYKKKEYIKKQRENQKTI